MSNGSKIFLSGFWLIAVLCTLPAAYLFSQPKDSALEKLVSMQVANESVDVILNRLSVSYNVSFSYSPTVIEVSRSYSGNFNNIPLREALNKIFNGTVEYKTRGKYIILLPRKINTTKTEEKEFITFSGYVRNENGDPVSWASVYNKASLESTVSNDYGFYRIRFSLAHLPVNLYFSKQNYIDTLLVLDGNSGEFINVSLRRRIVLQPEKKQTNPDSLADEAEKTAASIFSSLERPLNARNINDTIRRKWQVSFLPFAGTNGRLSGNVINEYSFNVLGGYSMGTSRAELSGVFNLNRGNVSFLQIAGFANVTGGKVNGVQVAGFTNVVKEDVSAIQVSGFLNSDFGRLEGVQVAGFLNTLRRSGTGVQCAGFGNVARQNISGTQAAGFFNVCDDTLKGTQVGFINYARHLNGSQLGFINVATSTTGVPVGFLSFVRTGYHKVEIAADEVFYTNISLRTGVNLFHNILTAGVNPSGDSLLLWNFGYGVGTTFVLGKRTGLDFDLTASQIVKGNNFDKTNLLTRGYLGVDIRLARGFSMALGATVNGQITNTNYSGYPDIFTWYEPNIFYRAVSNTNNTEFKMWLGAKVGLRFF